MKLDSVFDIGQQVWVLNGSVPVRKIVSRINIEVDDEGNSYETYSLFDKTGETNNWNVHDVFSTSDCQLNGIEPFPMEG